MITKKIVLVVCCALVLGLSGCSRQQSDWEKARAANTTDSYEQFLKKYPSGEFTAQAQARVKELNEERDWQKARDADTPEAYQAFLKQHPEGKWTEEARIRVENFSLAQAPTGSNGSPSAPAADTGASAAPAAAAAANPEVSQTTPAAPEAATPAAKPSTKHATNPAKSKGKEGAYGIQLGAFKSGAAAANRRWAYLQKKYPTILAGLTSKVAPRKTAAGTVYRLQATGLSDKHALLVCKRLKAKSQACVVVRPAHR
jgi:cell division protein FtsN